MSNTTKVFQIFKTEICWFHIKGRCERGAKCTYAHSEDELRERPDMRKTRLCIAWKDGLCIQGENCVYAHGLHELRQGVISQASVCLTQDCTDNKIVNNCVNSNATFQNQTHSYDLSSFKTISTHSKDLSVGEEKEAHEQVSQHLSGSVSSSSTSKFVLMYKNNNSALNGLKNKSLKEECQVKFRKRSCNLKPQNVQIYDCFLDQRHNHLLSQELVDCVSKKVVCNGKGVDIKDKEICDKNNKNLIYDMQSNLDKTPYMSSLSSSEYALCNSSTFSSSLPYISHFSFSPTFSFAASSCFSSSAGSCFSYSPTFSSSAGSCFSFSPTFSSSSSGSCFSFSPTFSSASSSEFLYSKNHSSAFSTDESSTCITPNSSLFLHPMTESFYLEKSSSSHGNKRRESVSLPIPQCSTSFSVVSCVSSLLSSSSYSPCCCFSSLSSNSTSSPSVSSSTSLSSPLFLVSMKHSYSFPLTSQSTNFEQQNWILTQNNSKKMSRKFKSTGKSVSTELEEEKHAKEENALTINKEVKQHEKEPLLNNSTSHSYNSFSKKQNGLIKVGASEKYAYKQKNFDAVGKRKAKSLKNEECANISNVSSECIVNALVNNQSLIVDANAEVSSTDSGSSSSSSGGSSSSSSSSSNSSSSGGSSSSSNGGGSSGGGSSSSSSSDNYLESPSVLLYSVSSSFPENSSATCSALLDRAIENQYPRFPLACQLFSSQLTNVNLKNSSSFSSLMKNFIAMSSSSSSILWPPPFSFYFFPHHSPASTESLESNTLSLPSFVSPYSPSFSYFIPSSHSDIFNTLQSSSQHAYNTTDFFPQLSSSMSSHNSSVRLTNFNTASSLFQLKEIVEGEGKSEKFQNEKHADTGKVIAKKECDNIDENAPFLLLNTFPYMSGAPLNSASSQFFPYDASSKPNLKNVSFDSYSLSAFCSSAEASQFCSSEYFMPNSLASSQVLSNFVSPHHLAYSLSHQTSLYFGSLDSLSYTLSPNISSASNTSFLTSALSHAKFIHAQSPPLPLATNVASIPSIPKLKMSDLSRNINLMDGASVQNDTKEIEEIVGQNEKEYHDKWKNSGIVKGIALNIILPPLRTNECCNNYLSNINDHECKSNDDTSKSAMSVISYMNQLADVTNILQTASPTHYED